MRLLIFLSLFLGIALLCIGVALLSLAIVATVGTTGLVLISLGLVTLGMVILWVIFDRY